MGHHHHHHQFNSIYRPLISSSTNNENEESIIDPMRITTTSSALSIWNMNHGTTLMSQLGQNPNNNSLQDHTGLYNPIVSCHSSNSHQQSEYPLNWFFGNKLSPSKNNTSDHHQHNEVRNHAMQSSKELNYSTDQPHVSSVPSLYINQHQVYQTSNASTNMSATALLQKAAQIGATSTTDPSVNILGNFGSISRNNDISQFCGFFNSPPLSDQVPTSVKHIIGSNHIDDHDHNDVLNGLDTQMYPSKRRHITVQNNKDQNGGGSGGQTRDFLGVGVQTLCHQSTMNRWDI